MFVDCLFELVDGLPAALNAASNLLVLDDSPSNREFNTRSMSMVKSLIEAAAAELCVVDDGIGVSRLTSDGIGTEDEPDAAGAAGGSPNLSRSSLPKSQPTGIMSSVHNASKSVLSQTNAVYS